ncbi:Solute carrier organic anion transporter family member 1C1 [Orchesella cincta]|uniref:Solute carrier organic anion transporter family member n=1 Tax=Orchesella cincta TaxID=48709 RepID=A0A1D2NJJ0_ORCCI|nr:Solute carrier organic anion transporter family member 1C1 [Orchesella cincta]
MSQLAPTDKKYGVEGGGGGETTYYFDQQGVPLASQSISNGSKPGQITSLVPDLLDPQVISQSRYQQPHQNDDQQDNNTCGIGPFQPEWIQKFASKKAFMVVFSLLAIVQSMCWSYFTATITTLEKRFKISSQTAGIVMTGNEMSQIIFSLILAYYGGRGHRPRWMAAGVLISAASCFVLASPHYFYGPGNDALSLTEEYAHVYETPGITTTQSSLLAYNSTTDSPLVKSAKSKVQLCKRGLDAPISKLTDCEASDTSIVPLILIFISQFVSGIGVLLFYTLGGPYLDDNIKKTKSPMLFGVTMSMRLVGPTFGFLFAGYCLKLFISPMLTPTITLEHPQWLGAWWLGWVVLGVLMVLTSFLIALFPRELPRASLRKQLTQTMEAGSQMNLNRAGSKLVVTSEAANENPMPRISEMPAAVKALITNKINLFNNLAGVFYIFSAIGYWTYMPKYLETIFMQTAVNASVISGVVSIAFQAVGLLVSGALISKYQPSARLLAGWNVFLGFLYVIVKFSFTQMGCDPGETAFGEKLDSGEWNLTTSCNLDCNCKSNKVFPVCYRETNQVFYSACHAGCTVELNGTISNCACIADPMATLTVGTCNQGCFSTFVIFLGVNAAIKLLDSSGRIGNMLVSYRCVDPKDKSLAIGFSIFLISVLAMLPSPILFGKIFDAACLVWGTKCGARGNCWLYDGQKLRYWFNLFAAAFTFLGAVFDCLVWYYVKDLDLYDEDKNVRARIESTKLKKLNQQSK